MDSNPANCKNYALNNFCKPIYFVNGVTVPVYCPVSCGVCASNSSFSIATATTSTGATLCSDMYAACPTWKSMQWCNLYPVNEVCKKSCSLC